MQNKQNHKKNAKIMKYIQTHFQYKRYLRAQLFKLALTMIIHLSKTANFINPIVSSFPISYRTYLYFYY